MPGRHWKKRDNFLEMQNMRFTSNDYYDMQILKNSMPEIFALVTAYAVGVKSCHFSVYK